MDRKTIEATLTLEEAIKILCGRDITGRTILFDQEGMDNGVAEAYNQLGLTARRETYRNIAEDFKVRTGCYGENHPMMSVGTILEVGCGSGLLALELAEQTNGNIIGIDVSNDMLQLAHQNATQRKVEKKAERDAFLERYPQLSGSYFPKERSIPMEFRHGSVYDLAKPAPEPDINYIVCRNTLHRFEDPEKALQAMYDILAPGGKIYLRDLKRDAPWKKIVERIGSRWDTPLLVEDYLKAMAGMLTMEELQQVLAKAGIMDYNLTDGDYADTNLHMPKNNEFQKEVEFVAVIQKTTSTLSHQNKP